MAELAVCEKKLKRAKKKKQVALHQLPLSNIPEESLSFEKEEQIICENAAENFLMDVTTKAAELCFIPCLESSSDELTDIPKFDEPVYLNEINEIILESVEHLHVKNETKVEAESSYVFDYAVSNKEDKIDTKIEIKEENLRTEISTEQLSIDSLDEVPISENTNEKGLIGEHEKQRCSLKPSVFVGKGTSYSSSLQSGHNWDRTKFNVVLLPDLSKVVYPDLDSIVYNKPSTDPFSSHGSILRHDRVGITPTCNVDRSSKPKPHTDHNSGNSEMTRLSTDTSMCRELAASTHKSTSEALDISPRLDTNQKMNTADPKFTDYIIDGVDFRVFMNPVRWAPADNYQLVVFRVGPLYYEEFFTNCSTTEGLIQSIKKRAEKLSKYQLLMAQACLLTELDNSQTFYFSNANLVIYDCPKIFNAEAKWQSVRFGVNEGFYQEYFPGCNSVEDVIKAVKNRAEAIIEQQRKLRTKAYLAKETVSEAKWYEDLTWEDEFSNPMLNIANYNLTDDYDNYTPNERQGEGINCSNEVNKGQHTQYQLPLPVVVQSEPTNRTNGLRRKLTTIRKWLADKFSKKNDNKRSSATRNERGSERTGSNDIVWQWTGTPENSPISLQEYSENVKE